MTSVRSLSLGIAYEIAWRTFGLSNGGTLLFIAKNRILLLGRESMTTPLESFSVSTSFGASSSARSTDPFFNSCNRLEASPMNFIFTVLIAGAVPQYLSFRASLASVAGSQLSTTYGPVPAVFFASHLGSPALSAASISMMENEYIGRICRNRWFVFFNVITTEFSPFAVTETMPAIL